MSYSGRCGCGKVVLAISGEPVATRQCWCRHCQRIAVGGPTQNAMFLTTDVVIEGEVAPHSYAAHSGNTVTQWFCPACGTHIFAENSARPQIRGVRFGVLDQPHGLAPQMAIWTDEAPPWAVFDPALQRFAQQPPPPPMPK
ncbi:MAG: GFA family protein [Pseudomonadota bacterium]